MAVWFWYRSSSSLIENPGLAAFTFTKEIL